LTIVQIYLYQMVFKGDCMEENLHQPHKRTASAKHKAPKLVGLIVGIMVIGVASFFGGVQYQKGKNNTVATTDGQFQSMGGNGMMGSGGGQRMGEFGSVTAVSSTSLSFNSQRTGSVVTYAITSSTTITENGATVSASDIAVGDMVLVESSGSGSSTATNIVVNPSPTGGPQMQSGTTQTN
jgi:hypothetical protein